MKKRIVSSIMCLAMLLSLLPASAFAAGETAVTLTPGFEATADAANTALGINKGTDPSSAWCDPNTMYMKINNAVVGDKYTVKVTTGTSTEVWSEAQFTATKASAKVYFAFGAKQDGHSISDATLAAGNYTFTVTREQANGAISTLTSVLTLEADGDSFKVKDGVTPTTKTVAFTETGFEATAAKANTALGVGSSPASAQCDPNTMWAKFTLDGETGSKYTMKVTNASNAEVYTESEVQGNFTKAYFTVDKDLVASNPANHSVAKIAAAEGVYTFTLMAKDTSTVLAKATLDLGKLTVKNGAEDANPAEVFFNTAGGATVGSLIPSLADLADEGGKIFKGWQKTGDTALLKADALKAVSLTGSATYVAQFAEASMLDVSPFTGNTELGGMMGSTLASLTVTPPANATSKTFTVSGTSNYVSWPEFSSVEGQTAGNYVALTLSTEVPGAVIKVTSPTEGNLIKTIKGGSGVWAIRLQNFSPDFKPIVKIYANESAAEALGEYVVDLTQVTRTPASTNAAISAVNIGDAAITLPETTSSNAATPAEIKATFAVNSDATPNSLDVVLTVDPTATVKTVAGVDGTLPANEAAYNVNQTVNATTGVVSISTVDLTLATAGSPGTPAKALYIMVTAQDGTTKAFYKITAEMSAIAVADVATPVPDVEVVPEGDQSAVTTAGEATTVTGSDTDTLKAAALAKAEADDAVTQASAKKALEDSQDVTFDEVNGDTATIYVVPSVKVEVTEYETTEDGSAVTNYTVDIKPVAIVYATTADVGNGDTPVLPGSGAGTVDSVFMKEIELKNPGAISVDIGVPAKLANDGEKVYVVHKTDRFLETVTGGKVTVEVSSFSPFTLTKATDAVLSGITLSNGTLSPAFAADTTSYTASVANGVSSITVTPEVPEGLTATVKKDGTTQTGPISLDVGENAITIEVTGTGLTATTYTLTVTRAAGGGGSTGGGGGVSSNVTVNSATNGRVTINPTAPSKGATVTITATPNTGYEVGTVTVKDANGNDVTVTKVSDTQYSFTMPDGKVTVSATFTQVQQPSDEPFVDVSKGDYFYDAVLWAVDKGITTGDGVNTFSPNKSCTRAQMVTFLWRAAGSPAATGTNPFVDVPAGEYYTDAVLWAVSKGITNGTGADTFSPNDTVTRGQTVTFLYRYAGSPTVEAGDSLSDVASTDYFATAVQWAVNNGITNGNGVNTFGPVLDCTRGQIVTFMYRQMAE